MGAIERFDHSLSAGGIVMIVIAAIGVLTAFTTIICLFVTSKKRSRVNQRLESASSRPVSSPRSPNRPQNLNPPPSLSPHIRTHLPMFPDLAEHAKYPPSYEEAMRMSSSPTTPVTPNASRAITPSGTPPPVFEEAQTHPLVSSLTPTIHLTPPPQQQQQQHQQILNSTKSNESTTVVDETAPNNENAK
uniref:Uncharacterized protein n=1 Tax=Panagrolaimus sp. ES5 TaxID=591445 RepID=A0AC34FJA9_9BILA